MRAHGDNGFWGLTNHEDKLAFVEAWLELRYQHAASLPAPVGAMPVERECDPLYEADMGGEA